ncbi:MAG: hypothetical protein GTN65_08315, partial [Armatimonadetes bacterium]|nr:hypothetical protein [Armatimonadota bacterium]NIO97088.1 hypothetical protein [Armatimonadota bacterium]
TPIVGKKGIRHKPGRYVAPELGDFVNQKVEIREDLADAGKLYVFELHSRTFICTARDAALEGLTVEEVVTARARQRKRVREEVRALKALAKGVGDPMLDLLAAKSKEQGQVAAFHQQEPAEGPFIQEAESALKGREPVFKQFEPEPEDLQATKKLLTEEKVVPLHGDPFFQNEFERYRYLLREKKQLTQKDRAF